MKIKKMISKLSVGLLLTLTATLTIATEKTTAYKAAYKGFSGTATLSVQEDGSNYRAVLAMKPGLLFRVAISSIVDSVEGTIEDGIYKPSHYHRVKNGDSTMLEVSFFDGSVSTIDDNGKQRTFNVSPNGQDPLTQIMQIQYDLKNDQLKREYKLVTDRNQRIYSVTQQGQQVTLVEQGTKGKPRRFALSFDTSSDTLLKMEKFKKGKSQLSIVKSQ